jgi:hypothetical protein
VDGSLMWFVATITLRRFVAGSGRRPPHQERPNAAQQKSAARSAGDLRPGEALLCSRAIGVRAVDCPPIETLATIAPKRIALPFMSQIATSRLVSRHRC